MSVQMATSDSACAAHDLGGGGGAFTSPRLPATTVTSVARPSASRATCRGMTWFHIMEKCGSTSLFARGRLSQI